MASHDGYHVCVFPIMFTIVQFWETAVQNDAFRQWAPITLQGGGDVVSMTNLVSNTGVVATDTTGVGTARAVLAAASYG
jgi:hypothetical protein